MPKDSNSLNEKEDSTSSKMIAVPLPPQVEEVLMISDDEQESIENKALMYEARINEKLKELGLYEDGMTMQQKEELLTVVVASWQTAEEEKSRRQLYQDYVNVSEAFCNEQLEFSSKEAPECSNRPLLFDIPHDIPLGSFETAHSENTDANSLIPNGDISDLQKFIFGIASSDSSLENHENPHCASSTSEFFVSSQDASKVLSSIAMRVKENSTDIKQSSPVEDIQSTTNIQRIEEDQNTATHVQPKIESIEHCMSQWVPCLSPKDTSLSCPKKPWLTDQDMSSDSSEKDEYPSIAEITKTLDDARLSNLRPVIRNSKLINAYHLKENGTFTKSIVPDLTDKWVGVGSQKATYSGVSNPLDFKEPFSRTSSGAFRYVQAKRTKAPDFEAHTTRSGLRYGLGDSEDHSTPDSSSKLTASDQGIRSPVNIFSDEIEVILDEDLPKFDSLRPDLFESEFSEQVDESKQRVDVVSETKNHVNEVLETVNHKVASCVDGGSSDESVIDVETIVDDQIEEFVLKRKLLQECQSSEMEPNTSQSKRLKKSPQ